jgi:anti-sigma factor RsiW
MTTEHTNLQLSEPDEIEALLPWYVTGKLTPEESARVARYLETHAEAATHVQIAQEERAEVIAANEMLGLSSSRAFERLMASASARPQRRTLSSLVTKWVEQFGDWLESFTPVQLSAIAVAAALVLLIQAVSIGLLLVERPAGESYQTASGPRASSTTTGTFAIVSFVPGASIGDVAAFLSEIDAEIVEGPKGGGIYRLRLSNEHLLPAAAEAAVQKLVQKKSLIAFAALAQ